MTDDNKRKLTGWEKTAITIIVLLVFTIAAIIFRDHIEGYINTFLNWYKNGS